MGELTSLTLKQTSQLLKEKKTSSLEVTKAYLKRIKDLDGQLKSFLTVNEKAEAAAKASDDRRSLGDEVSIFEGIPVAYKDVLSTKDLRTTCASRILEDYVPVYNATVVDKLDGLGVINLGKTNMDEFAMGSSTENSAYFPTSNPWQLNRVPGGSSGGSAAALAAGMAAFTLGTDTGGSIRQPAAFCGVVGFKPTYGRVSRYGLIAMASSLDQIGPFAKTVEDAALIMEVISGFDPKDNTSVGKEENFSKSLDEDVKDLKVGLPKEFFGEGLNSEIKKETEKAVQKLEDAGAIIKEISLPHTDQSIPVYYLIMPSEVSSNLARFDGIRFGGDRSLFGAEVKRRIMLGTYALSSGYYDAYYLKASKVRTLIIEDFNNCFETVDVIVGPTTPTTAFELGEKTADPLEMYLNDFYTIPANIAGLPALSLNCGFIQGLPVGFQIIGKQWDEAKVLNVGNVVEKALNLTEKPKI